MRAKTLTYVIGQADHFYRGCLTRQRPIHPQSIRNFLRNFCSQIPLQHKIVGIATFLALNGCVLMEDGLVGYDPEEETPRRTRDEWIRYVEELASNDAT